MIVPTGVDMPHYLIHSEPIPAVTRPTQCQYASRHGCYEPATWRVAHGPDVRHYLSRADHSGGWLGCGHPQHLPDLRAAGWRRVAITERRTMADFAHSDAVAGGRGLSPSPTPTPHPATFYREWEAMVMDWIREGNHYGWRRSQPPEHSKYPLRKPICIASRISREVY